MNYRILSFLPWALTFFPVSLHSFSLCCRFFFSSYTTCSQLALFLKTRCALSFLLTNVTFLNVFTWNLHFLRIRFQCHEPGSLGFRNYANILISDKLSFGQFPSAYWYSPVIIIVDVVVVAAAVTIITFINYFRGY